MDDLDELAAPSLPLGISVPLSLLFLLLVVYAIRKLRYAPASLVILACWLRYVTSIFHDFTFRNSPLGPTWNALVSIGIVAAGLFVLRPRLLLLRFLVPFYLLLAVAVTSAVVNSGYANLIVTVTKLGYLIVVMLCTYMALMRLGERFFTWLMVAFVPPFAFQLVSVLIGQTKSGETDGSVSYVGGYNHEGAISIVLCTALMAAGLVRTMPGWLRGGAIVGAIIGIVLADYRTTIIAFSPFLLVYLITGPLRRFRPTQRAMLFLGCFALGVAGFGASFDKIEERFGDLAHVTDMPDYLTRSPGDFNREDQQLFSGRAYLWARYLDAWRQGPPHYAAIGAGPEARIPTKDKYPHNTLISAVYEYGYLGLFTYLILLLAPVFYSLQAAPRDRLRLVAAHCSFFILNMATMPLWQIEGNILYGLLCGYTLYAVYRASHRLPALPGPFVAPGRA